MSGALGSFCPCRLAGHHPRVKPPHHPCPLHLGRQEPAEEVTAPGTAKPADLEGDDEPDDDAEEDRSQLVFSIARRCEHAPR
jgi:hypothetical protein